MIEEAAADVRALMATEAFTHWHRRERSYMRQLVRSGIGPLRQELSKSLLQRGRTANLLGERFEALCAELVYELLLPSAKAELEQGTHALTPISAVTPTLKAPLTSLS